MPAVTQIEALPARPQAESERMKAVCYDRYGAFDVLELKNVARPVVGATQVLVRVRAAALHIGDVFSVKGEPLAMRLATGLFKPKHGTPGFDLAGHVEAVGEQVARFKPGDAVFGASHGTCAEYVLASEDQLALKPAQLDFEQAAVLATSGLAALHALRDVAKLARGQKLLIVGAAGGVGSFAVQIAKVFGAEVSGVCSTRNVEFVRSLGADHVIDYTQRDFTVGSERYDVIFDNVENRALADCRRALTPGGLLILNSGTGTRGWKTLVRLLKPLVISRFVRQTLRRYLSVPKHEDLVALSRMVEAGSLMPTVDRTYSPSELPAALAYIETGHVRGKVAVRW
ncbi:MAG: Mycocerosic acid synthase [Pseudomonadota bacterium]|jgi:NADPH:quinone reductase-like Zn-dependent oxidoreductase